jgi:putative heme iron utilization protein
VTAGHIIPGWEPAAEPAGPARPAPPEPSHAERARTLIAGAGRGALSTIARSPAGTPFGSVVTYGLDPVGQPWFFVSTMAEHTQNLDADPRASLLVVEDAPPGADPLAAGRVTLLGRVEAVQDPGERAAARTGYLAANPSAFYVDYGDFRCLRLRVSSVRYVGGFGRMSWVDPDAYAAAAPDPLAPGSAGIIAHMNADHAPALVKLCHHAAGRAGVRSAAMTAVDRYGFEVVASSGDDRREALRIGFRFPQESAEGVRRELIAMLAEARQAEQAGRGGTSRATGTA